MSATVTIRDAVLNDEPAIRYSRTGIAETTLTLTEIRPVHDPETGETHEVRQFYTVTTHGELAENCALSLSRRMVLTVGGELVYRSWQDDNDEPQSRLEIVATDVGPSLQHATADVQRTERRHPSTAGPAAGYIRPLVGAGRDLPPENTHGITERSNTP